MKPKKRQKLCYNCEGEIDLDVIVCPFCAADLREEKPEQIRSTVATARPLHGGQMSQSLYPPPYGAREEAPAAPISAPPEEMAPPQEKSTNVIGPTLLFAIGAQLLLLGLLLALFSHHGTLVLKWDARLWFLYLFASVPLLIFGYRALSKLD